MARGVWISGRVVTAGEPPSRGEIHKWGTVSYVLDLIFIITVIIITQPWRLLGPGTQGAR